MRESKPHAAMGYIEAQAHGAVRTDRDVAFVRANFAKLFGNPGFKSLYQALIAQNKEIRWYFWDRKRKGRKFGNLITLTPGDGGLQKEFETAWIEAEHIWKVNAKVFERFRKSEAGPNSRAMLDPKSIREDARLTKECSNELYDIWQRLVNRFGNQ